MSKGKKYNIPRKYLHKYPVRKWNKYGCRRRYKVVGGKKKMVKKQSLSFSDIKSFGRPWMVIYL